MECQGISGVILRRFCSSRDMCSRKTRNSLSFPQVDNFIMQVLFFQPRHQKWDLVFATDNQGRQATVSRFYGRPPNPMNVVWLYIYPHQCYQGFRAQCPHQPCFLYFPSESGKIGAPGTSVLHIGHSGYHQSGRLELYYPLDVTYAYILSLSGRSHGYSLSPFALDGPGGKEEA